VDYLGLFCLGAFVGAVATLGLRFASDIGNWQKVLALILPAVLSGAALVFVDKFKYSPALGCYPLGLLISLLWAYADLAVRNIQSTSRILFTLGCAHLTVAVLVTATAATAVTLPAVWQLMAEYGRPARDILGDFKPRATTTMANQLAGSAPKPGPR